MLHPISGEPLLQPAQLARLQHLDALWANGGAGVRRRPSAAPLAPQAATSTAYDVALVGSGLSLLFAPLLAARGLRVVVIERAPDATPHREWNASANELQALVEQGLCSQIELDACIVARYHHGICRWHGQGSQTIAGVLDCAVDAAALWRLAGRRARDLGVTFIGNTMVHHAWPDAAGVTLALAPTQKPEQRTHLRVGVMIDGRGAASPYAQGDLICPTVGGVLTGLDEGPGLRQIDPKVGEILVTTEGVEEGRQHLWEAFPNSPQQTAVYLFYYSEPKDLGPRPLATLYARFVANMPRYKEGPWRMLRPTFGMIPGWSRLKPGPCSPHARIVLVGDAASRHSPLTFCGFGAMLRSLPVGVQTVTALCRGEAAQKVGVHDAGIHGATGALAMMLARAGRHRPDATNALLHAAFATLQAAGPKTFASLLQDTMQTKEMIAFLWQVSRRYPGVWHAVWRQLGVRDATHWAWRRRFDLPVLWQG
jgi:lycopene cyclase CruA